MNTVLYEKFAKLEWLLKRKHMLETAGRRPGSDPSRGQGRVLAALKLRDNISTRDLSYILGISVVSLNETLARLDRDGLITRIPSEEDRRVSLISLTDAGRTEAEGGNQIKIPYLDCLSDEEQVQLESYLDRIIERLEIELGEKSERFNEQLQKMKEERRRIFEEEHGHSEEKHGKKHGHGEEKHGHGEEKHGHGEEEEGEGHGHRYGKEGRRGPWDRPEGPGDWRDSGERRGRGRGRGHGPHEED